MGPTARAGLIFAMIALAVGGQLLEREFARRRKSLRDARPAASTYADLLAPLPPGTLPAGRADAPSPGGSGVEPGETHQNTYLVRPGDTLTRIARRVYGAESAWKAIYEANRATIPDPARLQPGTRLRLPRREPPRAGPARSSQRPVRAPFGARSGVDFR